MGSPKIREAKALPIAAGRGVVTPKSPREELWRKT